MDLELNIQEAPKKKRRARKVRCEPTPSYPSLVYRCPGEHRAPKGTYSFKAVLNDIETAKALNDGWHLTLDQAVKQ